MSGGKPKHFNKKKGHPNPKPAGANNAPAPAASTPSIITPELAKAGATTPSTDHSSNDYYFNSYAHFGIHEEMLKDESRMRSYRTSIIANPHLIKDKIVLDVGCGTGIMSIFAAAAGAKLVIGIECSNIAFQAKRIVADNKFSDRIVILHGKVEELELPVPKVDIIVSEWMGYFLFYESMLDTVLWARDKWLVEGGLMMPDIGELYMVGIEDADYKDEKIAWWDNVHGFDMSCIKSLALKEPLVDTVDQSSICTSADMIFKIDTHVVKKEELTFDVPFKLVASRNDHLHGFVCYFDMDFSKGKKSIRLATGPRARYTHWKQTVFYLEEPLLVSTGEEITGRLTCKPNDRNPRDLDITISYEWNGKLGKANKKQEYFIR